MRFLSRPRRALGFRDEVKSAIANKPNMSPPVEGHWTLEPPNLPAWKEAEAHVKSYSFWYHRIYLGNGVYTLPPTMADQVWALSFSFITKRLLDQEILFINLHHCSLSVCDSSDWFAKELIKPTFPAELKGTSTLYVGSNAGFFSILAIMRGAGRILGIESFKMFLMRLNISEISGRWISNTAL